MTRPAGLAGAALTGALSALRTPLWLRGDRWRELLTPPANAVPSAPRPPRGVMRAARGGVRVLAAVPGSPWKDTCLYRSVAECLALRRYGIPAVVRIGVRPGEGAAEAAIVAHAWVVADPAAEPPPPDGMNPFSPR